MKAALRWMACNHVAANLLMLVLIIGGIIKGPSIKQEVFPEVSLDRIQVSVAYPGAGPEEVEEGIVLRIEESLTGVDGIKQLKAMAAEGFGTVTAEINTGEDPDRVLQDIKSEVDRISTFPLDSEKPVIAKMLNRREVISLVVYGEAPERSLRQQAEILRDELLGLPGITQVELSGVRPFEISVEIPEEKLRRYNLTLDQVAQRIRKASLDLPGGAVKTEGGQILLRTKERRYFGPEYADIVVLTDVDGTQLRLSDIAEVQDSFADTDESGRFDGAPAAMVRVYRVGDQKPIAISETVRAFVEQKQMPPKLKLSTWNDTSEIFQSRMNLLQKNAFIGLALVMVVLGLFLEIRLALWVMLGIPISFFGTLFLMPMIGVSINMISLFAFILALGILVDDAIVIGENIYEHRQQGKPFARAAMDGVQEVAVPVIFSILTTVAAFMPLVFVTGMMGKFIRVIPLIVITLLLVSLAESLFVLPAHLALGGPRPVSGGIVGFIDSNRRRFGRWLDSFIAGPYKRTLELALRWRYATLGLGIAMLLLTLGVVAGGFIKFRFMPEVDGDVIIASLQMPKGTPVEETGRLQQFIMDRAMEVVQDLDGKSDEGGSILRNVYAVTGSSLAGGGPMGAGSNSGSHLADIALFLTPSETRSLPTSAISRALREKVGELPGAESLTFASNLVRMGANIDIQLAHENFEVLDRASERIREALRQYPGVGDIQDSYEKGKQEIKLRLTPEARTLGLTEEDLGRQVRAAFYGAEALRLQRGRNEVKVMVRYPEQDRRFLYNLENMRVRTPAGGEIPLRQAAVVERGRGFSEINRTDRKRVINVTAGVDSKLANAEDILAEIKKGLLPRLSSDYPGLSFNLEGEDKERADSMASMREGFTLALVMIFALLAIPFRSYSQPLLIMAAIPFGMVGAVGGHLLMGYNLSLLSMFGLVALSGVVVNDSLLLIDRANQNRREGKGHFESLIEAGTRRFRPILLTSLTTFFGLSPMILETSVQAQFLIPMAISLGFGILFATGITLVLIPALYLILEDVRSLIGFGPQHANHEELQESGEG